MKVSALSVFPVKSLAGVSVLSSSVTPLGLHKDRRLMFVDERGRFISQREIPQMALIKPVFEDTAKDVHLLNKQLILPLNETYWPLLGERTVTVWGRQMQANIIAEGLSLFGYVVDLVWVKPDAEHSFADSQPILLMTQESFDFFAQSATCAVEIKRFRPNIILKNSQAWAEDQWKRIRIGNTDYEVIKSCARCQLINVHQDTATMNKDVLKSLAAIRLLDQKIKMGILIKPLSLYATLQLGDVCTVLE